MELRKNNFNPVDGAITISPIRAEAIEYLDNYYAGLFMENPELDALRTQYTIPKNSIKDKGRMRQMSGFFFWANTNQAIRTRSCREVFFSEKVASGRKKH